jgi:hypothetical protein
VQKVTTTTTTTNNPPQNAWDLSCNNYTYLVETLSELFYGIGVNKSVDNGKLL